MDLASIYVWPAMLLLARVSALLLSAPLFSAGYVPTVVKAGLAVVISMFFGVSMPLHPMLPGADWTWMTLMLVREIFCGLAIGLSAQLMYLSVQQAGILLAQQMGMTDSQVIDPTSNQESEVVGTFMEMTFALLFLAAGGHHLLLSALAKSYAVFPIGATPNVSMLAGAVMSAGSSMLLFALKLAAPALGAFLVLSLVLAVLARTLPDMNILFESFPLRVALGLIMATAMIGTLDRFNGQLGDWMKRMFST